MKSTWIVFIFCALSLMVCAPSANAVNTAIAQTQAAFPTKTPIPTNTPSPTATLLPSPTSDVRLIDIDPGTLLLQKSDLPTLGKYYLPGQTSKSPLTNSEIVSSWTVEEGKAYLAETGRIHGWSATYRRGTNSVKMPEEVYDNVVIYSTVEGAQVVVKKYSDRELIETGYKEMETHSVGEDSRLFRKEVTQSSGATRIWLRLVFRYRNIVHVVELRGWQADVPTQFVVDIANKLFEALKQLPLSEKVTFSP